MLITFEGADGVGKTTQAKLLTEYYKNKGLDAIYTNEPGGTQAGKLLREIVLGLKSDVSPEAERCIMLADHVEHLHKVVLPAIKQRSLVISDRGYYSALVYQGYARDGMLDIADSSDLFKTMNLYKAAREPLASYVRQIVLWIDLDPSVAINRMKDRQEKDRNDLRPVEWHTTIRNGFNSILNNIGYYPPNPRVVKLDGSTSIEDIHHSVIQGALTNVARIKTAMESQINKAFAYILKSSPKFYYARNTYNELKCKDITKTANEHDLLKKVDVIRQFQSITKIDTLSRTAQAKMGERIGAEKTPEKMKSATMAPNKKPVPQQPARNDSRIIKPVFAGMGKRR